MFSRVESSSGKVYRQKAENSVSADFEKCLKKEGVRYDLTVPILLRKAENSVSADFEKCLKKEGVRHELTKYSGAEWCC